MADRATTIRAVTAACPTMVVEALVTDFKGDARNVDVVLDAGPDIFAHNPESVPPRGAGVEILTSAGTSPSRQDLPVKRHVTQRHVTPDGFHALKQEALAMGFAHVESGPLVQPLGYHGHESDWLHSQRC